MKRMISFIVIFFLVCAQAQAQIKACGEQLGIDSCNVGASRFMAKGVAYQPRENVDPLTDDNLNYIQYTLIPALKTMSVNTIRVYQVCPNGECKPHDKVMNLLRENNIYVMVGLADYAEGTNCTVDRSTGNYSTSIYECFTKKIDEFSKYPNVMGFSVGNETWLMPHKIDANYVRPSSTMKALIRDMKAYIKNKNYNKLVGVVLRDTPDVTVPIAHYYACHLPNEKQDTSADFIGYNVYRWGGGTNPGAYPDLLNHLAGYRAVLSKDDGGDGDGDQMKNGFSDINVPVLLTEFGRVDTPRLFEQVQWLFTPKDTTTKGSPKTSGASVFSGGMVFRLIQRPQEDEFGLYTDPSLTTETNKGGLDNLITEYANVRDMVLDEDGVNAKKITCNTDKGMGVFELDADKLPIYGSGSDGTHSLEFNRGGLLDPLPNISINYKDNSGWHPAKTIPDPKKNINYTVKIPDPKTLELIGINFNGNNGACILKASLLCADSDCTKLRVVSAKWYADGQGACELSD